MNAYPKIQTHRCVLSCINNTDIPILRQIFDDDATKRYLRELNDLVSSEDGIKQFLYSFSCYVPDKPTLFYAMHPAYRSQGIMKECILEAVSFILKNLSCDFIQSEVYKDNVISIKLLQSANFEIIGSDKNKVFLKRMIQSGQ